MKAAAKVNLNPQVDAYLDQAPSFALPILMHLRALLHKGCPEIEETIKWSRPFFLHRGVILGNMAAFKQHCNFGFWGEEMKAVLQERSMGSLDRITSVKDIPSDKLMLQWIRQAAALVENGQYTSPMVRRRKTAKAQQPAPAAPLDFTDALRRNSQASIGFAALNLSCKREYIDWISEAKRPETRNRRIANAIEWIAEGKPRHWKYQSS